MTLNIFGRLKHRIKLWRRHHLLLLTGVDLFTLSHCLWFKWVAWNCLCVVCIRERDDWFENLSNGEQEWIEWKTGTNGSDKGHRFKFVFTHTLDEMGFLPLNHKSCSTWVWFVWVFVCDSPSGVRNVIIVNKIDASFVIIVDVGQQIELEIEVTHLNMCI